jgi:hypothetical protein
MTAKRRRYYSLATQNLHVRERILVFMNTLTSIFIGIVVIILIVVGWFYLPRSGALSHALTLSEALSVASAQGNECTQAGSVGSQGSYDAASKTWSLNYTPNAQSARAGCSPVCVVSADKKVSIDWRCSVAATTSPATPASKDDMIVLDVPLSGAKVGSPLVVQGRARGGWYFEASFPVKIYDASGKLLGSTPAQAQGDWMTSEYVPFKATLTFSKPTTATGRIVLEKDNPSGLPENANELSIPVTF